MTRKLEGKVAVVAGATRGAGRGIACMLGEVGATVYCTGRSTRNASSPIGRPETIEETAEMVDAHGGRGIWACLDHRDPAQVRDLFDRVSREQGRLDVLVNVLSGDLFLDAGMLSGRRSVPFWQVPIENGLSVQVNGVHTHLISCHYAAPMLIASGGCIIEVTDGNRLAYNDVGVHYSLSKTALVLLAHLLSAELRADGVAAVSVTPGWLRSEKMLDGFGVSEETWQEAIADHPGFEHSETPYYVGRAVAALASDPELLKRSGHSLSAGFLAREYGFTDVDGRQPPGYRADGITVVEGVFENGSFHDL